MSILLRMTFCRFYVARMCFVWMEHNEILKFGFETNWCDRSTNHIFSTKWLHPCDWIEFCTSIRLRYFNFVFQLLVCKYHVSMFTRKNGRIRCHIACIQSGSEFIWKCWRSFRNSVAYSKIELNSYTYQRYIRQCHRLTPVSTIHPVLILIKNTIA